jgi:DNA-binding SARP family transcriptional activator
VNAGCEWAAEVTEEHIRYSVLGPVRAWRGDAEVDLGGPRQQTVLVVLLRELNRPVPMSAIVDAVWGEQPPGDARSCVYSYISRLRNTLHGGSGPGELVWSPLKRALANLAKRNLAQLTALVKTRLRRMQYRPGLLDGFLASTRLDLAPFSNTHH